MGQQPGPVIVESDIVQEVLVDTIPTKMAEFGEKLQIIIFLRESDLLQHVIISKLKLDSKIMTSAAAFSTNLEPRRAMAIRNILKLIFSCSASLLDSSKYNRNFLFAHQRCLQSCSTTMITCSVSSKNNLLLGSILSYCKRIILFLKLIYTYVKDNLNYRKYTSLRVHYVTI